jgi:phosphohistidine phosphatase
MKKLIFVRHGRAEEQSDLTDFERSLTTRGKIISAHMASLLSLKEQDPCLFITSPAFRAYETAMIFARELNASTENVILNDDLYHRATLKSLAEILETVDDKIDNIILFGHNPAFTEIPDRLSKEGCDFLPKSGVVCLAFRTDTWKGIVHGKGKIEYFLKPDKTA